MQTSWEPFPLAPNPNRNERGIFMNVKNEIKSIIVRSGMTMQQVVDLLSEEYGWSDSISNNAYRLNSASHNILKKSVLLDS